MKKRVLALVGIVALVGLLLPAVVFSAEDTVTCTVSTTVVSLTVSPGSVDYGKLELGRIQNTAEHDPIYNEYGFGMQQTQTITNSGSDPEAFAVKTSGADGMIDWTIATTAGADTFTHGWNWRTTQYYAYLEEPIVFTKWTEADTYALAEISVPSGDDRYLELEIGMPTLVSDFGVHNITVTIMAYRG